MYHNFRDKNGKFTSKAKAPKFSYTWTGYNTLTVAPEIPVRRLFFDIETSPNTVFSWSVGRKINIDHSNILDERAVICVCWKWEGNDTVGYLKWNKGDDKQMLKEFCKILNSADEIVTHNGDSFDVKWLRTRCLLHGIEMNPKFKSIDTLKVARKYFRFNSNRLNYLGQYLGVGQKIHTEFSLWKDVMKGDAAALANMVTYCQQDVRLLEQVYNKLKPYMYEKVKKNKGNL